MRKGLWGRATGLTGAARLAGFYYHARNLAGVHIDEAVFQGAWPPRGGAVAYGSRSADLLMEKLPHIAMKLNELDVRG